ncbi:MAG: AAA family ATPase [Pseudonocardia sp.]
MTEALPVAGVDDLREALDREGYLADDALATALYLALRLRQPVLLEGEAGVGKTHAARALAAAVGAPLLRIQCYEGLTAAETIYEWNYPRQLLAIRVAEARGAPLAETDLFTEEFLLARPLLAAITHPGPTPAVLLVDEVDRADDEFEAFLFEALAEAAVTIPELGTRRATVPPVVVLTSNRTRDLHDALKRRCLYHWIAYPGVERVERIVARRVPGAPGWIARQVAAAVGRMRGLALQKPPGVAEAVNWADALQALGVTRLDEAAAARTLSAVLKYPEDVDLVGDLVRDGGLAALLQHG